MRKIMAYQIDWTEYEREWGTRPDGSTLHKDHSTACNYIDAFIKREKERNPSGDVPDYYTKPSEPFMVEIDEALEAHLEEVGSFWVKLSGTWRLGIPYKLPPKQELTYYI